MASPRPILILGHSYIRRLGEFTQESTLPDVDKNFGLNPVEVSVDVAGFGGKTAYTITQELKVAGSREYHGVVLQLGGNDLCNTQNYTSVAASVIAVATFLRTGYGIRKVAICQAIRRTKVCDAGYNGRVVLFNIALEEKLASQLHVGITMWKHRGFWNTNVDFQHRDGVHLNDYGQYKYYKSIRGAILHVCK